MPAVIRQASVLANELDEQLVNSKAKSYYTPLGKGFWSLSVYSGWSWAKDCLSTAAFCNTRDRIVAIGRMTTKGL